VTTTTAEPPPPPSATVATGPSNGARVARAIALGLYGGALAARWKVAGIPLDREQILLWLAGFLIVATIGSPRGGIWRVVRDWLPVALVLIVYDLTRGAADGLGIRPHLQPQLDLDRWMGLGEVPTVRLQQALYHRNDVQWWEVPVTLTYISHFFVPFVVAGVFWMRDRPRYWRYIRRFVTLSFLAALTFVAFPAVPPWLASRVGELDPVFRTAPRGWVRLNLDIAKHVLEMGQRTANVVAAIPSLHAGYTLLVAWALWPTARRALRAVLCLYVLGMGFVLVLTGEHYVTDILIGWLYVAFTVWGWDRIEGWWAGRQDLAGRSRSPSSSASTPEPGATGEPSPTATST